MSQLPEDTAPPRMNCGVVIPVIGDAPSFGLDRLQETRGLAEALQANVNFAYELRVRSPNAGYLLGAGQIDSIGELIEEADLDFLIVDSTLSPVQQRNLERRLNIKVVDRTGLILEIFGLRARSAEGRLQVEMARLLYERSRLVRTWTHLERQRGGRGFLAGPGESQLEADRRMLDSQIGRLKASLAQVKRTRKLQRTGRQRRGKPVVALVGYTNAGKSTLFNKLAGSDVFAADMPFATLDPTTRDIQLNSGRVISLVDTVGFITDLPTTLVESFQATIEEAIEADFLLHVRDISAPETDRQSQDVEQVLAQLESDSGIERPELAEVWNKADLLSEEMRAGLQARASTREDVILMSAMQDDGISELLDLIEAAVFPSQREVVIKIPPKAGAQRAWLHQNCMVLSEEVQSNGDIVISANMSVADQMKLKQQCNDISMTPDVPPTDAY